MERVKSSRQLRTVALLALGWGCAVASLFITVSSGTAAARVLKGKAQATLPVGVLAVCATAATLSCQQLIRRTGRRLPFMVASAIGILGAGMLSIAVHIESFPLMVLSSCPQGIAYGVSNLYRFMAVEATEVAYRERALAAVVGGAVLSAFIGPEASRHVRDRLETDFLAAFLLAAGLWTCQLVCISAVDYSLPQDIKAAQESTKSEDHSLVVTLHQNGKVKGHRDEGGKALEAAEDVTSSASPRIVQLKPAGHVTLMDTTDATAGGASAARPWHKVVLQYDFLVAAYISSLSFFVMSGLMAATPLAMGEAGATIDDSTLVIEAHIIAMYLPSFVTGSVVRCQGAPLVVMLGSILLLAGNAFFFVSTEKWVFWLALILIGIGWNFNYVSASNMVLKTLASTEKSVGQGMFDVLTLSGLSVAMISSGFTFDGLGWRAMYSLYLGLNSSILLLAVFVFMRHARR